MRGNVKDLNEYIELTEEKARQRRDFVAPMTEVRMTTAGQIAFNGELYGLRHWAKGQMATYLGIPSTYWNKMEDAGQSALLSQNANTWLNEKGTATRMLRTVSLDRSIRAVLSDRYLPIDDDVVLNRLIGDIVANGKSDITVSQMLRQEHRTDIVLTFNHTERKTIKGQVVRAGIRITNSEVGYSTMRILPVIYTLICSNGAVMGHYLTRITRRHIGARFVGDVNYAIASEETLGRINDAFWSEAKDYALALCNEERWGELLDIVNKAQGWTAERSISDVTDSLQRLAKLTSVERDNAVALLVSEGNTRWGASSVLTNLAQSIGSNERGVEMEELGGRILTDDDMWRAVA